MSLLPRGPPAAVDADDSPAGRAGDGLEDRPATGDLEPVAVEAVFQPFAPCGGELVRRVIAPPAHRPVLVHRCLTASLGGTSRSETRGRADPLATRSARRPCGRGD